MKKQNNPWYYYLNGSLVKAFDAYADAGATYNGQRIKNTPQLKEDIHKLENRCNEAIEELKAELKNLNK